MVGRFATRGRLGACGGGHAGVRRIVRGDVATAECAMEPSIQADEYRLLAAKVVQRDLAFLSDGVEHNVRRAVARLKRAQVNTRGHFLPPTRLVEKRQHHKRFRVEPVLGANFPRQSKLAFGFCHIAGVEIKLCEPILTRKKLLRFARLPSRHERSL